jgi:hypothetical protein
MANFLSKLGKVAGGIAGIAANLVPGGGIIKTGLQLAGRALSSPVGRTITTVGTLGAAAGVGSRLMGNGSSNQLPALPALANVPVPASPGGLPIGWKGAGGKMQMPWSDPRIPEYLKQFALDDAYLKIYYRAPRGYVICRDAEGRAFAVNKTIARQFGLWKPTAKPPISATDYKNYKRNQIIEKKLIKIAGPALRKHSRKSSSVRCTSKKR